MTGEEVSHPQALLCGVLQNLVLSAVLFNSYMRPLDKLIHQYYNHYFWPIKLFNECLVSVSGGCEVKIPVVLCRIEVSR